MELVAAIRTSGHAEERMLSGVAEHSQQRFAFAGNTSSSEVADPV
jgi:hypothetical protein